MYGASIALGGVVAMLAAPPAHGYECRVVNDPVVSNGQLVWEPHATCDGAPAVEPRYFTAIAISESTLSWGTSWGASSRGEAEQIALTKCRQYASDCKVVDWAQYECLALAVSKKDGAWGVDAGNYPETASAKAMAQCRSGGGTSCVVQTHPCSQD